MRGFLLPSLLLMVFGGVFGITEATDAQDLDLTEVIVSLELNKVPLKTAFDEIEKQTDLTFAFSYNDIDSDRSVSVQANNKSVDEILKQLFQTRWVSWALSGKTILLKKWAKPEQDDQDSAFDELIEGQVTDAETGETLPGVNILVKGTMIGASTNQNGNFELEVPSLQDTLVVTYIGYQRQEIPINGRAEMDIQLIPEAIMGEEMVVVGYGTQKEANVSGAVSSVTSEKLEALEVNTMGEALQGKIPGVFVDIADGKPGRSADFNIRGVTSINGGSPLIVIDGVPQSSRDINNISPQDIEEISVLKDASSTAIYGSRASFGVILITTKKGSSDGDTNISVSTQQTYSTPTKVPKVYDDPEDYLEINENEFNANIGQSYWTDEQVEYPHLVANDPSLPKAVVRNIGGRPNLLTGGQVYNYYEEWFNKYRPSRNYRISVDGGNDKLQYYISGDYNYEQGSLKFKPEKIDRYGIRSNFDYKINDNISIFNYTSLIKRSEEHPNQYLYGFTSNIFRFIENSHPMMPEYVDIDGERIPTDIGFYREFLENQSGDNNDMYDTKSTLGMEFSFFEDELNIHIDGTYQFNNSERHRWWDNSGPYLSNSFNNRNIVLAEYSDAGPSTAYKSQWRTATSNLNSYATYQKSFGNHNTTFMLGYNQESYSYNYDYAEVLNPLPGQNSLNLGTGDMSVSDDDSKYTSRSGFLRINYDWKEKYLFEANGNYFLTSKFSKEKRGHPFLSFSGAWRLSQESFFDSLRDKIQNLKLRASYGSTGNSNIGAYDYLSTMEVNQSSYTLEGDRVSIMSAPAPKSPNFTWETVKTTNFGLDFAILGNRLKGSIDVFQRITEDMLANYRSLPSVFGASVPKENIAALKNEGFEIGLNWTDNFELYSDNFAYGISINLSDYTSEITDYYNPTNYLEDYYEGQKLGEIWGLKTLGFFKTDEEAQNGALLNTSSYKSYAAAGNLKFDDINNDGVISWGNRTLDESGDYRVIGNSTPRYQYGITLNAQWKGFDFNAFFKGVAKRDIYPSSETTSFWGPYNRKYQVMLEHTVKERWTPDNPDAYFPRPQGYIALGGNDLAQPQTRYLQDASYIRLKNLTIGYSLRNLRIYLSGRNLWTRTNLHHTLDPEGLQKDPDANASRVGLGTAYSIQRSYSVGLEFNF